jgi:hypothetical protein
MLPKEKRLYTSSLDCYRKVVASQGIRGLWTGWVPNVARNSTVNACELASYDQIKQTALVNGFTDTMSTHLMCACLTAIVIVAVCSPVDCLKVRLMNRKATEASIGMAGLFL